MVKKKIPLTLEHYFRYKAGVISSQDIALQTGIHLSDVKEYLAIPRCKRDPEVKQFIIEHMAQSVPHDPEYAPTVVAKYLGFPSLTQAIQYCGFKNLTALRHYDCPELPPILKALGLKMQGLALYPVGKKTKAYILQPDDVQALKANPRQWFTSNADTLKEKWTSRHPPMRAIQKRSKRLSNRLDAYHHCINLWRNKKTYKEIQRITGCHAKIVTQAHRLAEEYPEGNDWERQIFDAKEWRKIGRKD